MQVLYEKMKRDKLRGGIAKRKQSKETGWNHGNRTLIYSKVELLCQNRCRQQEKTISHFFRSQKVLMSWHQRYKGRIHQWVKHSMWFLNGATLGHILSVSASSWPSFQTPYQMSNLPPCLSRKFQKSTDTLMRNWKIIFSSLIRLKQMLNQNIII